MLIVQPSHRLSPRLLKELLERCLVRRSILDSSQTVNRTFSLPPFHLTFNFKSLRPANLTYHVNSGALPPELQLYCQLDSHLLPYLSPSPIRRDFQNQHPSTQHLWMPFAEESLRSLPPPPLLAGVEYKAPARGLQLLFFQSVASLVGPRSAIDNVLQDTKCGPSCHVSGRREYAT